MGWSVTTQPVSKPCREEEITAVIVVRCFEHSQWQMPVERSLHDKRVYFRPHHLSPVVPKLNTARGAERVRFTLWFSVFLTVVWGEGTNMSWKGM